MPLDIWKASIPAIEDASSRRSCAPRNWSDVHVLLDGDYHSRVCAGVCVDRARRKALPPARFCKTFAMVSATAIALTLVPILCVLLLRGKFHSKTRTRSCVFTAVYRPALSWRWITVPSHSALLSVSRRRGASGFRHRQRVHAPLNEGDIMFMPIADASISLRRTPHMRRDKTKCWRAFPKSPMSRQR